MSIKSEAMRIAFAELGDGAKARQVREHLAAKKIKVKDQLIYAVKRRMNGVKTDGIPIGGLLAAKQLVEQSGGIDRAKEVLAVYEKLI